MTELERMQKELEAVKKELLALKTARIKEKRDNEDRLSNLDEDNVPSLKGIKAAIKERQTSLKSKGGSLWMDEDGVLRTTASEILFGQTPSE